MTEILLPLTDDEPDLLRDAIEDRITFHENYVSPDGDDEVTEMHRESAGDLRVVLLRLDLLQR